ncbi:MAG: aconitate hydratase [Chitinivibrionales bacterium]|nr:aconitate hydratase [Chitinivibrionales bacterium]MBD3395398.1 aconitate hydratase [Chitinivibrionales bacterium]
MGKNIVEKIIDSHIVEGTPGAGNEIGIRIDQTLTQDATGTMAYLEFEALGYDRVQTELSVSYVDHNTIQEGFENADDHAYLESVARRYGIRFSRPGNGICHQVHLERFGLPGKTLLGSDSHTPTGGGVGMAAIGAGGLDVAVAMGGGPFYLTYPRVIKVELTGHLRNWVSAKDVILRVLDILSTRGNVGCAIEYGGSGVATLDVPERATITNMGAELGVTMSVFPSDDVTREWLKAQGREKGWIPLAADPDAAYDRTIEINLSELVPMAACPHSPGNVAPLKELDGMKVDQVLIGSCTNASFRDLMLVAQILKDRKVCPHVTLGVSAGSRQVLEMIAHNGALADIVGAGARVLESVCGFCIGNSLAPGSDAVSVRTNNRNFFGRSGTPSAQVYLVSPEAAAAIALAGVMVDPMKYLATTHFHEIVQPARFHIDDSMVAGTGAPDRGAAIVRGPNIGEPPSNESCPDTLAGVAAIKVGDKVTTDDIMPAGNRLKYRSNVPRYAEFVFERTDPEFSARALANKNEGRHNVIIAGDSYGQGSSREHAAICPMFLGVKMVVAKSIERIHRANLINFGIIPALFVDGADYEKIERGDEVHVSGVRDALAGEGRLELRNPKNSISVAVRVDLSEREKGHLLAGGLINAMRKSI